MKKRFSNINLNILNLKDEENKFYVEYINQIYLQYKEIFNNDKTDKNYIMNEKIRLKTTIKYQERKNFNSEIPSGTLVTILVTIIAFTIGQVLNIVLSSVNFKAQNSIKNITNIKIISRITDIYAIMSERFGNEVLHFSIALIIITFLYLCIQSLYTKHCEKVDNIEIAFNRMCLEVLSNFEKYETEQQEEIKRVQEIIDYFSKEEIIYNFKRLEMFKLDNRKILISAFKNNQFPSYNYFNDSNRDKHFKFEEFNNIKYKYFNYLSKEVIDIYRMFSLLERGSFDKLSHDHPQKGWLVLPYKGLILPTPRWCWLFLYVQAIVD